jgi:hypothetical protein
LNYEEIKLGKMVVLIKDTKYIKQNSWIGLYQNPEKKETEPMLNEEEMNEEEIIKVNKNYLTYQKASEHTEFYIEKNGEYLFKFFENKLYLHQGKTLSLEIKEEDSLNIDEKIENETHLRVVAATWNPYQSSTWVAFYNNSKDNNDCEIKKNEEYFKYYYVDRPVWSLRVDNLLSEEKWNVRLFKTKELVPLFSTTFVNINKNKK